MPGPPYERSRIFPFTSAIAAARARRGDFKMAQNNHDLHILPRPVERLPEYAHAKARQTLAERLVDAFKLSETSASAIANAVVNPSEVRAAIGAADNPDVERIPV